MASKTAEGEVQVNVERDGDNLIPVTPECNRIIIIELWFG